MTHCNAPLVYSASSLETAACLWEAVLDMEQGQEFGSLIQAARKAMGSSHLRLTVIGWTDMVDAAWQEADGCEDLGRGGQYGAPFDWEFVPGWIAANVDWTNPHSPQVLQSKHTEINSPRPWDGKSSSLQNELHLGRVEFAAMREEC